MILTPRRPQGFRSQGRERPFLVQDPQRQLNEIAVLRTEPRQVIMIASFSNPQARIVVDGYRFMWFEGETMFEEGHKLTRPIIQNVQRLFPSLVVLADTDYVIDEAVLVEGQDRQIANFSFRDRFVALHRPDYHLEWTEGAPVAPGVVLGPEALT